MSALVLQLALLLVPSVGATMPLGDEQRAAKFAQANEHYRKGELVQAIEAYEAVIQSGPENGHLRYDLGNAHLKSGNLGQAIGNYLTAQRLMPRDEDLAANLALARKRVTDRIEPPRPGALSRTAFFWVHVLSARELLLGAAIAAALALALLTVREIRSSEWMAWAAAAAGLLALACGAGLLWRTAFAARVAVVEPAEIEVRAGPERSATTLFRLHAGAELRVDDAEGDWLKVSLADGKRGWLRRDEAFLVE